MLRPPHCSMGQARSAAAPRCLTSVAIVPRAKVNVSALFALPVAVDALERQAPSVGARAAILRRERRAISAAAATHAATSHHAVGVSRDVSRVAPSRGQGVETMYTYKCPVRLEWY